MKQKTAIDLLIDALDQSIDSHSELKSEHSLAKLNAFKAVKRYAAYLKKAERERIEEAYDAGLKTKTGIQTDDFKWGGKYYQQKYGDEPTIKND